MARAPLVAAVAVGIVCYVLGRLHGAQLAPTTGGRAPALRDHELESLQAELQRVRTTLRENAAASRPCSQDGKGGGSTHDGKEVREIVSLSSGMCMDFNALQNGDLLSTWACHKGACGSCMCDGQARVGRTSSFASRARGSSSPTTTSAWTARTLHAASSCA